MSETEESIRAKFELRMFKVNDSFLRGAISEATCQKTLKNLQTAMNEQIERCKEISKVHRQKKRVE